MKNKICYLLSFFVFFNFIFIPYNANAITQKTENNYIIYQYSNGEISNDKIKFDLYSTDVYFPTQANNKAVSVRAYSFLALYKHVVYQKHI